MEREFLKSSSRSVTLNITGGKIDSYREQEETTGTVRVYADGKIGVAGCLGEPEEEQLISRLFAEEYGSEFVFVTHYPSKKRPFYAADDPEDPRYTLSFDLLFRGLEVTTGGHGRSGGSEVYLKL